MDVEITQEMLEQEIARYFATLPAGKHKSEVSKELARLMMVWFDKTYKYKVQEASKKINDYIASIALDSTSGLFLSAINTRKVMDFINRVSGMV